MNNQNNYFKYPYYQFNKRITPFLLYTFSKYPIIIRVFAILLFCSNSIGTVSIRIKGLQLATAIRSKMSSKTHVIKAIKKLNHLGIISKYKYGTKNIYVFNPEFIWSLKNGVKYWNKVKCYITFKCNPVDLIKTKYNKFTKYNKLINSNGEVITNHYQYCHKYYRFRKKIMPMILYELSKYPLAIRIFSILLRYSSRFGIMCINLKYLQIAVAIRSNKSSEQSVMKAINYLKHLGIVKTKLHDKYILNSELIGFLNSKDNNPTNFKCDPVRLMKNNKVLKSKFDYARKNSKRFKTNVLEYLNKLHYCPR